MTNDETDKAYQALHDAHRVAMLLYMDLRDVGDETSAQKAKLRANRIQGEIDSLLGKRLSEWESGAERSIPRLKAAADAAKKAVENLQQDLKNAKKVASVMKALDKTIEVAMNFIG